MLRKYEEVKKTREQLYWFLLLLPICFYMGPAFVIGFFGG